MTYTPITKFQLRTRPGTLSKKLVDEFNAVKTEYDTQVSTINSTFEAGSKVAKVALTAVAQDTISFSWQNPAPSKILVYKSIMRITTGGVTNAVMDIGSANDSTTGGDNLMDGVAIDAAGTFDNVTNKGSNGKPQIVLDENGGAADYINGLVKTAAGTGLVGKVYIFYTVV